MFDEYGGGESMPLGGYAAILGAYTVGFGSAFFALQRSGRLPLRVETITKDWVTAPLRAPFTEYQDSGIAGEVSERSRGRGLRKAIGDLATCPFCTGPWVAGALVCGLALAPRITRAVAATFAAVAVSDFVHRAYEAAASASESASEAEPAAAEEPRSERVPIRTGAKSKIKATAQT
jgi:hypothetical protein